MTEAGAEREVGIALGREVEGVGIHVLSIPTPFGVGPVNAYLIEGSPLTLVDNGPNQATGLRELERQIAALGFRLEDLELLLVTHPHPDHGGLTQALTDRSGANVGVLDIAVETTETFPRDVELDDEHAAELMLHHGVAPDVVQALQTMAGLVRGYGAAARVSRPLREGQRIDAGSRSLTVHARPGHSPWDTLFVDEANGVLFSGDHLLPNISSNALVTRPRVGADRSHPLLDYRRSLVATRALDVRIVLGGHGVPFTDHKLLIDTRLRHQDERAGHILDLVGETPLSAHQIARAIWGDVAIEQAFLTISEVLGHLDLLLTDELVEELPTDPVTFRARQRDR